MYPTPAPSPFGVRFSLGVTNSTCAICVFCDRGVPPPPQPPFLRVSRGFFTKTFKCVSQLMSFIFFTSRTIPPNLGTCSPPFCQFRTILPPFDWLVGSKPRVLLARFCMFVLFNASFPKSVHCFPVAPHCGDELCRLLTPPPLLAGCQCSVKTHTICLFRIFLFPEHNFFLQSSSPNGVGSFFFGLVRLSQCGSLFYLLFLPLLFVVFGDLSGTTNLLRCSTFLAADPPCRLLLFFGGRPLFMT